MSFETDLEFGKDAEKLILKQIQVKYPLAFMIEGKFKAFDIFVPEIEEGVEVKCDRQAESTGNVFIEIECNGVMSGIQTTKSGWYIYKTVSRTFWVRTGVIRRYLIQKAKDLPMFCNTPKGEHSAVRGYLIPIEDFALLKGKL
tara:strand:- start:208 stop:636 length:429 start_codon:yes stop_codon:yes gene_type:complete